MRPLAAIAIAILTTLPALAQCPNCRPAVAPPKTIQVPVWQKQHLQSVDTYRVHYPTPALDWMRGAPVRSFLFGRYRTRANYAPAPPRGVPHSGNAQR